MAFDACMMRAVLTEFQREFPEAKIEKILQPANDEIDIVIHHGKKSSRLLFNVGPNAPRLQLTSKVKENPLKAPMFCMFLRKRLIGAKITGVSQPGFDRIAIFSVSGYDEMGFPSEMKMVCEIMGKYANFILLDGEEKIISALKIIDFSASTIRQILPGLKYKAPAMQNKANVLDINRELFFEKLSEFPREKSGEKFITSTYSGIATQIAHELVFRASGETDVPVSEIDAERFYSVFLDWQRLLIEERYNPTVAIDKSGKPIDYSYMDISYLGDYADYVHFETLGELFDLYFAEKDRLEKIHQRAHDIRTLLTSVRARTEKKLAIQREALSDSEKGETYKRSGDLITANMYRIKRGDKTLEATDYYDESCPVVTIELDERLSPAANAQRMYKLYNKCKTAKKILAEQISLWEAELKYLESVQAFLDSAETEQDISDIRDELFTSGYASRMKGYKPPKQSRSKPLAFKTTDGMTLYVGRNNIQNDRLTMKEASNDDIWFHVKDLPGSHVILVTDGKEPSDRDYTEAAGIAAGYSKATADLVAVDYTRVKNIKKPSGSKPGFVTYKTNYTAYVKPIKEI
ncbi:MAG: NFACT family protein [Clostridia bacterium]|nr:NFACT family protein [Clostridia bacterium]